MEKRELERLVNLAKRYFYFAKDNNLFDGNFASTTDFTWTNPDLPPYKKCVEVCCPELNQKYPFFSVRFGSSESIEVVFYTLGNPKISGTIQNLDMAEDYKRWYSNKLNELREKIENGTE